MKKIIQINFSQNLGSTGKIAEQIGELIISNGWESYIVSGRGYKESSSISIRINNKIELLHHIFISHFADQEGKGSKLATKRLVSQLNEIKPDLIHLHVIHESYINYPILFSYLKQTNIPVIWTFHDCWAFTGHCMHFDFLGCNKWKKQCYDCHAPKNFKKLEFFNSAKSNFKLKKTLFNSIKNLTIVPVSFWLYDLVKESFFLNKNIQVIHNGIDLEIFKPQSSLIRERLSLIDKFVVIGVASNWGKRKGFDDFLKIATICKQWTFIMVGLDKIKCNQLPDNIISIPFTAGQKELAEYYSISDVFLNTTFEDNYPTVNLEAIACGIPVVTYKTGGCPETVTEKTGIVVPKGDIYAAIDALKIVENNGKSYYEVNCRTYALNNFSNKDNFLKYIQLYKEKLNINI